MLILIREFIEGVGRKEWRVKFSGTKPNCRFWFIPSIISIFYLPSGYDVEIILTFRIESLAENSWNLISKFNQREWSIYLADPIPPGAGSFETSNQRIKMDVLSTYIHIFLFNLGKSYDCLWSYCLLQNISILDGLCLLEGLMIDEYVETGYQWNVDKRKCWALHRILN